VFEVYEEIGVRKVAERNVELEWSRLQRQFQLLFEFRSKRTLPIHLLKRAEFCEYQLYLERVKGQPPTFSRRAVVGQVVHEGLSEDFERVARPLVSAKEVRAVRRRKVKLGELESAVSTEVSELVVLGASEKLVRSVVEATEDLVLLRREDQLRKDGMAKLLEEHPDGDIVLRDVFLFSPMHQLVGSVDEVHFCYDALRVLDDKPIPSWGTPYRGDKLQVLGYCLALRDMIGSVGDLRHVEAVVRDRDSGEVVWCDELSRVWVSDVVDVSQRLLASFGSGSSGGLRSSESPNKCRRCDLECDRRCI